MKKIFPLILVLLVAGLIWYLTSSDQSSTPAPSSAAKTSTDNKGSKAARAASTTRKDDGGLSERQGRPSSEPQEGGEEDLTIRPAAEMYKSAEEAFEAIRKGSVDYDDLILEQFSDPGEDCSWCPEFYSQIKDELSSPETSDDQKSYYAEVLAISGKVENISALIDAVRNAPNQETSEIFAEALEVTSGSDASVKFLGEQMDTDNQLLKESLVAAITNHGSKLAVDTLYRKTVEAGDPDGFYSSGIGLGEIIPEEESIPALTELAGKRDAYSHLAVKALLNYGPEGLRIVNDIITNSPDTEVNKQLLQNAEDHVNYDEQTEGMLKEIVASSKSQVMVDFAREQLKQMEEEAREDEDLEDELTIEEEE
ncbi:MAG: hypothetical protein GX589_00375 [Deltaproteobacteria bacterium]|nr:hypothetical protein [Deltaproteobacteria bacterium]